jgi:hypothetical protein
MGNYQAPILYGPSSSTSGPDQTAGATEAPEVVEDHDESNEEGRNLEFQGGRRGALVRSHPYSQAEGQKYWVRLWEGPTWIAYIATLSGSLNTSVVILQAIIALNHPSYTVTGWN